MAIPNKKDSKKNNGSGAKPSQPAAQQPEVITPKVVKELPLEKVIENKLAENNVTKRVLNAMKDKYLVPAGEDAEKRTLKPEFVLKNNTDKETYLAIKTERKAVRKVGIITEEQCKKGREDAIRIQKLWLGKEKEVLGEVGTVQDLLDEQIEIYEAEEKRLHDLEEERKDNQLNVRQNELIKMGAVNANGCMNINDLSIENSSIREADDETYNETILPLFKMHYESNEKERIQKEEEKKQQDLLLKQQQDKLKEEQDALKKQQDDLQKQKEQFEQQQKELREQKIKNRCLQLEALGMKFSFRDDAYIFEGVNVDNKTEACLLDDAEWETLLQKIKPAIENAKAAIKLKEERQNTRSVQLSGLGMTFTGSAYQFEDVNVPATDLTGMDDNTWNELIATTTPIIADRKQKLQAKQEEEFKQKQIEEQRKQQQQQEEEAAKASDKDKWTTFVAAINGITIPEMKSSQYKSKVNAAKLKLTEITQL